MMGSFWDEVKRSVIPSGMSPEDYNKMLKRMMPYSCGCLLLMVYWPITLLTSLWLLVRAEPLRIGETMPVIIVLTAPLTYLLTKKQLSLLFSALPAVEQPTIKQDSKLIHPGGIVSDILAQYHSLQHRILDRRHRGLAFFMVIFLALTGNVGLVLSGVLALNRYSDSTAQSFTIPIEGKYISHQNKRAGYHLYYPSPVPSILPFEYDPFEDISTNKREYERVTLGQTTVTIHVHQGSLGLPWHNGFEDTLQNLKEP